MCYTSLSALAVKVNSGHIRLPDFQRPFVWNEEKQKSMVASYLIGVPLGSLLLFEGTRAQYSSVAVGTKGYRLSLTPTDDHVEYLLDGQQRITTLMSVFCDWFEKKTSDQIHDMLLDRNPKPESLFKELHRRWFIDLNEDMKWIDLFGLGSLSFDAEGFQSNIDAQRLEYEDVIKSYVINNSNKDQWYHPAHMYGVQALIDECIDRNLIPLFKISDQATLDKILEGIKAKRLAELGIEDNLSWFEDIGEHLRSWYFDEGSFLMEQVPIRRIHRGFYSFSKRNSSGAKLKAFDLLTARAAIAFYSQFNQNALQSNRLEERIVALLNNNNAGVSIAQMANPLKTFLIVDGSGDSITSQSKKFFSQLVSVYSIHEKGKTPIRPEHTKTAGIIEHITPDNISDHYEVVTRAIVQAAVFCYQRLGVCDIGGGLPYAPMFLPIAYVHAVMGALNATQINKIEAWYWMTLFSGEYGKDSSSAAAKDCNDLLDLVRNNIMRPRFSERYLTVSINPIQALSVGPLSMSKNPLDNTKSIALAISSFVHCVSGRNGSLIQNRLLTGAPDENIFDHPVNYTCAGSTIDAIIGVVNPSNVDRNDPNAITTLYQQRSTQLTNLIRQKIALLGGLPRQ